MKTPGWAERLHRLALALASTRTLQEVSDAFCAEAIHTVGAQDVAVYLIDESRNELCLKATAAPRADLKPWSRIPVTTRVPLATVTRSGEPMYFESRDALFAAMPDASGPARDGLAFEARVILPLTNASKAPIGSVAFSFAQARAFDDDERRLLMAVAQQCAVALDRARAQEAEAGALRRFRSVYENALDGIVLSDDEGRIVDVNPAACAMMRRMRDELLGHLMSEFTPPSRASIPDRVDTLRSEGALRGEGTLLMRDGSSRAAEFGAVANVSPGLHLTVFRDVEDQKRAERGRAFIEEATRILASSLDYDETLSAVAQLAVPRIADWAVVYMLEGRAFRIVALAHSDPRKLAIAREVWASVPPTADDGTIVAKAVRINRTHVTDLITDEMLAASVGGSPHLLPKLRELGLLSALTAPITARGKPVGAIALISAESRRRFENADLAIAEELARRASTAAENALALRELRELSDTKDRFLRRARSLQEIATRLVHATHVDELGRAFTSAHQSVSIGASGCALYELVDDHLELLGADGVMVPMAKNRSNIPLDYPIPAAEVCRTGQPAWMPVMADVGAGYPHLAPAIANLSHIKSAAALPLVAGDQVIGSVVISFAEPRAFDDDERGYLNAVAHLWSQALHRARLVDGEREALRRAYEAEADALRKKDEFLAMLGHELRNPLAPILTATSLIRVRGRASEQELNILERQARHLVRLVDDLLDISRITSGKLTLKCAPIEIADVITQAMESTQNAFQDKRLRLYADVPRNGLVVDGDRDRLVQVVTNLLINAAKFTPLGRAVFLSARRDGSNVVLEVRDEGEGIPSELLPRIFDVFTQGRQGVERSSGGLGLGLAIARSIVSAHRGTIDAESAGPGRGATISIRLPLVPSGPATSTGTEAVARADSGKHRVMVVDDNADGAEMLSAFLDELGYETMIAANAEQALALVERVRPDAAILDIGLPGMDGYGLAAELLRRFGDRAPPLLALTGYTQANDRERALAAGFAAHFGKPVDMVKLVATLERLLQPRPRTTRPSLN